MGFEKMSYTRDMIVGSVGAGSIELVDQIAAHPTTFSMILQAIIALGTIAKIGNNWLKERKKKKEDVRRSK